MKCQDVLQLLHPYSDGELDLVRHVEIEQHLLGCADCTEQEKSLRSLRTAISTSSLYHRAPASLRTRIGFAAVPVTRRRRRFPMQYAALAASILLMIGASATIGMLLSRTGPSAEDRLAELVVAGHVRSLQADHLTDVESSDRHTVKPWFRGKLDFSPQVLDLSPQGYALTGGRLDYLDNRPVAALVYHRRQHVINLFTWTSSGNSEKPVAALVRQGFNIRYWQRAGTTYWAVSDLNNQEFDEFVRLIQDHATEGHP